MRTTGAITDATSQFFNNLDMLSLFLPTTAIVTFSIEIVIVHKHSTNTHLHIHILKEVLAVTDFGFSFLQKIQEKYIKVVLHLQKI